MWLREKRVSNSRSTETSTSLFDNQNLKNQGDFEIYFFQNCQNPILQLIPLVLVQAITTCDLNKTVFKFTFSGSCFNRKRRRSWIKSQKGQFHHKMQTMCTGTTTF